LDFINAHLRLTGKADSFNKVADRLKVPVLGELPLVEGVSMSADRGFPYVLSTSTVETSDGRGGITWRDNMAQVAERVASSLWVSA